MKQCMALLKKHTGIVVISIATLLLLVGASPFLSNTEIFSAKASEKAMESPSDVSGEEIVVRGDLVAMARANLAPLADGDEAPLTDVPFTITYNDAGGNSVPMILDEEEKNAILEAIMQDMGCFYG